MPKPIAMPAKCELKASLNLPCQTENVRALLTVHQANISS